MKVSYSGETRVLPLLIGKDNITIEVGDYWFHSFCGVRGYYSGTYTRYEGSPKEEQPRIEANEQVTEDEDLQEREPLVSQPTTSDGFEIDAQYYWSPGIIEQRGYYQGARIKQ